MSTEPLVDGQYDLLEDTLPILKNLIEATQRISEKALYLSGQNRAVTTSEMEVLRLSKDLLETSIQAFTVLVTHGMDIAQHTSRRKV